jgi:hypothetical protein
MAYTSVKEVDSKIELFLSTDPANLVDETISNNTGHDLYFTFVKEIQRGKKVVIVADTTVPIPVCRMGEDITITAQMQQDALNAGNHSDIYIVSKRENLISSIPKYSKVRGGQTVPRKNKAKTTKK